jgi:hypothetical protein
MKHIDENIFINGNTLNSNLFHQLHYGWNRQQTWTANAYQSSKRVTPRPAQQDRQQPTRLQRHLLHPSGRNFFASFCVMVARDAAAPLLAGRFKTGGNFGLVLAGVADAPEAAKAAGLFKPAFFLLDGIFLLAGFFKGTSFSTFGTEDESKTAGASCS